MWIKEEILCICIALLDPRLLYTGIEQKDGIDSVDSFRVMAVLDSRVQRIFYDRFVNPRWHPKRLQSFSSVVINGSGSWKQEANWKFSEQFRLVADVTANPFMISIGTDECAALEAGGVYVASTTKKNGKPVYVQVSKKSKMAFVVKKGSVTALRKSANHESRSACLTAKDHVLKCAVLVFFFDVAMTMTSGTFSCFPVLKVICTF
jgi:hypothetical protein